MEKVNFDTRLIPMLLQLQKNSIWIDVDNEADVLYISFEKPQRADDSIMQDDGRVFNYRGDKLVGITVMNVSKMAMK